MTEQSLSSQLNEIINLLKWLPQEVCNVIEEREDVRDQKRFNQIQEGMKKFTMGFDYNAPKELDK